MAKVISFNEIASKYGVHRNTVRNWRNYYLANEGTLNLSDIESVVRFEDFCKRRLSELGRKEYKKYE